MLTKAGIISISALQIRTYSQKGYGLACLKVKPRLHTYNIFRLALHFVLLQYPGTALRSLLGESSLGEDKEKERKENCSAWKTNGTLTKERREHVTEQHEQVDESKYFFRNRNLWNEKILRSSHFFDINLLQIPKTLEISAIYPKILVCIGFRRNLSKGTEIWLQGWQGPKKKACVGEWGSDHTLKGSVQGRGDKENEPHPGRPERLSACTGNTSLGVALNPMSSEIQGTSRV